MGEGAAEGDRACPAFGPGCWDRLGQPNLRTDFHWREGANIVLTLDSETVSDVQDTLRVILDALQKRCSNKASDVPAEWAEECSHYVARVRRFLEGMAPV